MQGWAAAGFTPATPAKASSIMSIVRVKADVSATVYDATVGGFVPLVPGAEYDNNDPIVKANGWAFQSDADTEARPRARAVALDVEQATANPGEKRTTRR